MKTEIIGVWKGDNYLEILSLLIVRNTELRVRRQGKKLIIKDTSIDFYLCIPIGIEIEIPLYETPIIELEEIEEECDCCLGIISEEQKEMLKRWGLWTEEEQ